MKSLKLSNYFELIKPKYKWIEITSHKAIRNYNSDNLAKFIALTYKSLDRRIRREQKKIFFETSFKISFLIDIQNNDCKFYFIVPEVYLNMLLEKINEIWNKAAVKVLEQPIKPISEDATMYQMSYKREDALSLKVDKKSNEPLNSILSVMDILKDDDRVVITYNFLPCSQFSWVQRYLGTIEKIKENKLVDKKQTSPEYIFKSIIVSVSKLISDFLQVIDDFTGGNIEKQQRSLYDVVIGYMQNKKELSPTTKKKKESTVLDTQMAIFSESKDEIRKTNNVLSVCQTYRVLDEDNELIYKKVKNKMRKKFVDFEQVNYNTELCTMSVEETASTCLQIPGKSLLYQFKLNFINVEEVEIPKQLQTGYITLGTNKYKGNPCKTYFEDDKDIGSLGLVLLARQGGGKTTYLCHYSKDCLSRKESITHIDFIKNNEASKSIEKVTPKKDLIILDLSTEEGLQSLAYNEIEFTSNMTLFQKQALANKKAEMTIQLVDSINDNGEPLSPKMSRYLSAAANVIYMKDNTTLKDVVRCLQNYKFREEVLNNYIPNELKEDFEEEIQALEELDEYSKATKDNPSVKCGTKDSKIEGILDRISLLMRDFYLKKMFKKNPKDNINFVKATEQGKVILIRMPQSKFKDYAKNVITTFFMTKVWLACELRGELSETPKRTHVIVDEISQTKTAERFLETKLTQGRKFGFRPVLALQYLDQLDKKTIYSLKGSGASFMLLKGTIKEDFEYFKDELDNFKYEDLKEMSKTYKFPSLNIVQYSEGICSFITELPKPI
ncbi:AAA-like domain protein [Clostridium saccharobutylicum]|uniref:type IV secretion system DNA-binding domain-containing protein n=1 Tax=Clostridium saccharobutylicum TaxID=169679 RepID=UPI00098C614E|nr:type IV secretion system DNA-binding domain-containing protein [Clostridium saccharobutylicum]OOM17241.1 AAA-like domain protein [Clostridium saccharobutylicum]